MTDKQRRELFGEASRAVNVLSTALAKYENECEHLNSQMDDLEQRNEELDNYIQWLASVFVPEERWDEVYDQMTSLGIDYIGADDV